MSRQTNKKIEFRAFAKTGLPGLGRQLHFFLVSAMQCAQIIRKFVNYAYSMTDKDKKSKDLLARAYSLRTEKDRRELYQDWADTYDQSMIDGLGYLTPTSTASLLTQYLSEKNSLILDVGAGTGLAGAELHERKFPNLHALDYSAEMLAVAGERKIYRKLIEADLNQMLPFEDSTYDAMICTGTFTHAHVGADSIFELIRILKRNGLIACTVHKDIWEPQGFSQKIPALEKAGIIKTVVQKLGTYFSNSTEKEGWYIIWQKQ